MLNLKLNQQMLAVVAKALGQLPYDVSAPVIDEISKQVAAHNAAQEADKPAKAKKGTKSEAPAEEKKAA